MDDVGVNFASIQTFTQTTGVLGSPERMTDLGGDDMITSGDGKKIVLGGDGADTIKLGLASLVTSDHIVIGDNGEIKYVAMGDPGAGAVLSYKTTDVVATTGGGDTIETGSGNNVILGGMGSDMITTVDGTDTIIGDNGIVQMDEVGDKFAFIETFTTTTIADPVTGVITMTNLGGGDTITAGDGKKIVVGGDGADIIDLGTTSGTASDHIVIGDNGQITYVAFGETGAGEVLTYKTTDVTTTTGGGDTITTGDGNNVILGGMGADIITTASGVDTIIGDNGIVKMDEVGNNFASIETFTQTSGSPNTMTDLGGNDNITSGDGKKIVVGGDGADTIKLGVGSANTSDHIVIGDNGEIIYVEMGQPGAGAVLTYKTTDVVTTTGGGDTIETGSGNNVILGGMGADTITTVDGVDTIIGDNGEVKMDAVGVNFASIQSFTQTTGTPNAMTDLGGNDVINSGDGKKIVIGGDGADTANLGVGSANASDHIVIGDNGEIIYVAMGQPGAGKVLKYQTTDTGVTTGGADIITTGDGNNAILGGMGRDAITTGTGTDTIFGDNGVVEMYADGSQFRNAVSTQIGLGDDDTITTNDGAKTIVAGDGGDTVGAGNGVHVIVGDSGNLDYYTSGVLAQVNSTSPTVGGNDVVTTGNGDSIVIGGFGADRVTTGNGNDALFGDNAVVTQDSAGRLLVIQTTDPLVGDNDYLNSGDGNDALFGGYRADTLVAGNGDDQLLGDGGRIFYTNGQLHIVESIDPFIGGIDILDGGSGANVLIGGDGDDVLIGWLDQDILAGDYGVITYENGRVVSVIRYGSGSDLIATVQEDLFIFKRVVQDPITGKTVYVPADGPFDPLTIAALATQGYVVLPSLEGFNYQETHSGSDNAASETPAEGQPAAEGEQQQGEVPTGGAQAEEGRPQGNSAGATEQMPPVSLPENPNLAECLPGTALIAGANGAQVCAPDQQRKAEERSQPLALVLSGLVGIQAWYARPQAAVGAQARARVLAARAEEERSNANAKWINTTAAAGTKAEVLLDRRSASRGDAAPARLPSGALEKAARNWLDNPFGADTSVQSSTYTGKAAVSGKIDWNKAAPATSAKPAPDQADPV